MKTLKIISAWKRVLWIILRTWKLWGKSEEEYVPVPRNPSQFLEADNPPKYTTRSSKYQDDKATLFPPIKSSSSHKKFPSIQQKLSKAVVVRYQCSTFSKQKKMQQNGKLEFPRISIVFLKKIDHSVAELGSNLSSFGRFSWPSKRGPLKSQSGGISLENSPKPPPPTILFMPIDKRMKSESSVMEELQIYAKITKNIKEKEEIWKTSQKNFWKKSW